MSRDAKPVSYKKIAAPSIEKEEFRNTFAPYGQYADLQLSDIERSIKGLNVLAPQVADREPSPPLKGMIRYAVDPWHPLSSTSGDDGWVFYDGSAWVTYTADVEAALTAGLATKANTSHTHTLADITDEGALAALNTVGTSQIDNDAVTLAKLANIATATFLGRTTAGTGDPEALTATQATALLNVFTTSLKGLVPSGGSSSLFLRGDATWVSPSPLTLITSGSFSGTQVNLSSIANTWDDLWLEIYNLSHNGGGNRTIQLAFSTDGGSSFENVTGTIGGPGTAINDFVSAGTPMPISSEAISASVAYYAEISILRYKEAAIKAFRGSGYDNRGMNMSGWINTTSAINYLRFTLSGTGSFDAGSYRLYGVKR